MFSVANGHIFDLISSRNRVITSEHFRHLVVNNFKKTCVALIILRWKKCYENNNGFANSFHIRHFRLYCMLINFMSHHCTLVGLEWPFVDSKWVLALWTLFCCVILIFFFLKSLQYLLNVRHLERKQDNFMCRRDQK